MIKAAIVGGTGYTGVELLRLLAAHPEVELSAITSRSEAGQAVIEKMPLVMQGSMKMVRAQMQRVMPKIQQIEHEAIQQLKECCQSGS